MAGEKAHAAASGIAIGCLKESKPLLMAPLNDLIHTPLSESPIYNARRKFGKIRHCLFISKQIQLKSSAQQGKILNSLNRMERLIKIQFLKWHGYL